MIEEPIKYIQKVEIQGLFGRYDIKWNLHSDVNVLAGINGSGKTTILDYIYSLVSNGEENNFLRVNYINIIFNNEKHYHIKIAGDKKKEIADIVKNAINKGSIQLLEKDFLELLNKGEEINAISVIPDTNKLFKIDRIKTFEANLKPLEAVQKLSDDCVKSELDWELYQLQEKYKDYQINIARKKEAVFKENQGNPFIDNIVVEFRRLGYSQEKFLEIIDELFLETHKKVNRDKNELEFLLNDKEISAYQLSSGEKQLLIILLTVLVQDNKPAILLMDEPEISLHIEWQRKLIRHIRELNPNVQVIIATHSPDIIMEGWMDKVFNISDIIVRDNTIA